MAPSLPYATGRPRSVLLSITWTCKCAPMGRRPGVLGSERSQEHPGLLEVGAVEALREPAVDRRQQLVRLVPLVLLLPQTRQARGRPQLPGLGLLAAGNGQGLLKTCLGVESLASGVWGFGSRPPTPGARLE